MYASVLDIIFSYNVRQQHGCRAKPIFGFPYDVDN
jgi:hypothetical protein